MKYGIILMDDGAFVRQVFHTNEGDAIADRYEPEPDHEIFLRASQDIRLLHTGMKAGDFPIFEPVPLPCLNPERIYRFSLLHQFLPPEQCEVNLPNVTPIPPKRENLYSQKIKEVKPELFESRPS